MCNFLRVSKVANMKVCSSVIIITTLLHLSIALNGDLISNFTVNLVKTQQSVVFGCNKAVLLNAGQALNQCNQVILLLNLKGNYSLEDALTRRNRVKTSVIIDCSCPECKSVLKISSNMRYFNKTYQWMIWDSKNWGLSELLDDVTNIGPNTQMTYVNMTGKGANYSLFDVHSKGLHLNAPLEVVHYGDWHGKLTTYADIFKLQGLHSRDQFHQLTLRGGIVIDRDNITTNEQIVSIMAKSKYIKEDGLTPFIKYHYDLLSFLQERFNFTLNYRNPRGWAGRLGGSTFRLGYLGIVSRNEVDIGASCAFNRINRFAEYDTIHQSWKFESAFVYRFIIELDTNGGSGNFLAPFKMQVWAFFCLTIVMVIVIWLLILRLMRKGTAKEVDDGFLLQTLAAICQQGLDPIPKTLPSRTIVFTLFVFSLMMYNFYTSSVVGGLLSSSDQGPKTVDDIVNSPLKLAFEDIGYYKVLFMQLRTPLVRRMYMTKVLPKRGPDELQVFTHMKDSIPYLKKGGYAFHCELVDIFPEIARRFDANEICDLRIVSGLLETEVMNWIVPKNSMYTELFRIMMCRAREIGVVTHTLAVHRPEKPQCESAYTVYPVAWPGVVTAFELLGVGMIAAGMALAGEIISYRKGKHMKD